MQHVDFDIFDSDNHYYESLDAFTRYIDPKFRSRAMQWASVDGKDRLLVGGKVNRFIPNPTFDPISKPGALDEYFRGRNPKGQGTRQLFGELDRLADHPEYSDRDARLELMDRQGLRAAIFLPTLGVGMEQALLHDPDALVAAFTAFNRWVEEDWGFSYAERIYAAPIVTLVDADAAVREVETVLERDARFVLMMPGPVITPAGGRSPSDPVYDRVWQLLNDAGVTVVVHGGDSHYTKYYQDWGNGGEHESFRQNTFRSITSFSPVQDYFANLLAHAHFERFPNLRIAAIETGSDWVLHLFDKLTKSFGQTPFLYPEDPRETFRRHVWVSPYYEDHLDQLRQIVGVDRMLMGSDFPHAEGLAEPSSYIKDLRNFGFSDDDAMKIMRDNGTALAARQPA